MSMRDCSMLRAPGAYARMLRNVTRKILRERKTAWGLHLRGGRAKDFRGKCELDSQKDKVFNADNTWYSWACITLCDTHRLLAL